MKRHDQNYKKKPKYIKEYNTGRPKVQQNVTEVLHSWYYTLQTQYTDTENRKTYWRGERWQHMDRNVYSKVVNSGCIVSVGADHLWLFLLPPQSHCYLDHVPSQTMQLLNQIPLKSMREISPFSAVTIANNEYIHSIHKLHKNDQ